MAKLDLNPGTTALLVMDCQEGIVGTLLPAEKDKVLTNVAKVIGAARRAAVPIIYVVVQFREGYPEIAERNVVFSGIKQGGRFKEGAPDTRICPEIAPQPGDLLVVKKRISAFTGSDLEVLLRGKGIDTLVLTGVSSRGVVESTARFAFDLDYRVIVLGDCCSDRDPEANEIALKWMLPWVSTVSTASDFEAAVGER